MGKDAVGAGVHPAGLAAVGVLRLGHQAQEAGGVAVAQHRQRLRLAGLAPRDGGPHGGHGLPGRPMQPARQGGEARGSGVLGGGVEALRGLVLAGLLPGGVPGGVGSANNDKAGGGNATGGAKHLGSCHTEWELIVRRAKQNNSRRQMKLKTCFRACCLHLFKPKVPK